MFWILSFNITWTLNVLHEVNPDVQWSCNHCWHYNPNLRERCNSWNLGISYLIYLFHLLVFIYSFSSPYIYASASLFFDQYSKIWLTFSQDIKFIVPIFNCERVQLSTLAQTSTVPETSYPSIFVWIHSFSTKGLVAWIIKLERKFVNIWTQNT